MNNEKIVAKERVSDASGWVYTVTVGSGDEATEHTVSLKRETLDELGDGRNAEQFITDTFRFLLTREPKESILRSFDITDVSSYFPEFGSEIGIE